MRFLLLGLLLATAACATTESSRSSRDRDLLTLEEIEASDQTNAYDLIRTARPAWLRVRGPSSIELATPIVVYLDGNRMGGPETLTSIPLLAVEEIRFYSPAEAQSRFGLNHTNGAIAVTTRRG